MFKPLAKSIFICLLTSLISPELSLHAQAAPSEKHSNSAETQQKPEFLSMRIMVAKLRTLIFNILFNKTDTLLAAQVGMSPGYLCTDIVGLCFTEFLYIKGISDAAS